MSSLKRTLSAYTVAFYEKRSSKNKLMKLVMKYTIILYPILFLFVLVYQTLKKTVNSRMFLIK